jgi:hypothetical protein
VCKNAGVDLVGYDFTDKGEILVVRGRTDSRTMARILGVQSYDLTVYSGDERTGRPEDAAYSEIHVHSDEPEDDMEESTTEDVFFAQQIQEMRKLAGVSSNEVAYAGTPVVHLTKKIVENINKGYREVLKDHYVAYTRARRVERLPVTESMEVALRTVATTAALNPRASGSSVAGAVAMHTGVNHYDLSDYIVQRTGLSEGQFFSMFSEQEVEEKFSKSAHKWVDNRVEELYPTHIKDRGEAFGRAWNEYKNK